MKQSILTVIRERCPGKHFCKAVKNCPTAALKQDGKKAPTIDYILCNTCGNCVALCRKNVFLLE